MLAKFFDVLMSILIRKVREVPDGQVNQLAKESGVDNHKLYNIRKFSNPTISMKDAVKLSNKFNLKLKAEIKEEDNE